MSLPLALLQSIQPGRHVVVLGPLAAPSHPEGQRLRASLCGASGEDYLSLQASTLDQALRAMLHRQLMRGIPSASGDSVTVHVSASGLVSAGLAARELRVMRRSGVSAWIWAEHPQLLGTGATARALCGEAPYWVIDHLTAADQRSAELLLQDAGHLSAFEALRGPRPLVILPVRSPSDRPAEPARRPMQA